MEPFGGMVVDCRAKVFEIATGTTGISAVAHISAAGIAIYLGELFAAPPSIEPLDAAIELLLVLLALAAVI